MAVLVLGKLKMKSVNLLDVYQRSNVDIFYELISIVKNICKQILVCILHQCKIIMVFYFLGARLVPFDWKPVKYKAQILD